MEARSLVFQDSGLTGVLKVKGLGFSSEFRGLNPKQ